MTYENKKFNRIEFSLDNVYNSYAYGTNFDISTEFDGYIKCKLVHKKGASIILPELIIIGEVEFNWIQHFTFLMNLLVKDNDIVINTIYVDIAFGSTLKIQFKNSDLQQVFKDNSSLFKCKIYGPKNLSEYFTGNGYFDESQTPYLKLFHHTKEEFKEMIISSQTLKSSKWNFQGTKKLNNINFVYFTSIDEIKTPGDLKQIAMSNDGKLLFVKDNYDIPEKLPPDFKERYSDGILELTVYRESTENRKSTIDFFVDSTNLFTPNIWMHKPDGEAVYYELCNPFIFRLGLENEGYIEYTNQTISSTKTPIQEYVVIGDCTTLSGLEAPYDEENTSEIFKVEPLFGKINILDFWFENGNQDLYSDKKISKFKFDK